jgi:hypothetical protein
MVFSETVDTNVIDLSAKPHLKVFSRTATAAGDQHKLPTKREKEFEKYLNKKLKKEERPAIFERLQQLEFSSKSLQSTKNLVVFV